MSSNAGDAPQRSQWMTVEELTAKYLSDPSKAAAIKGARERIYALIGKKVPMMRSDAIAVPRCKPL